MKGTIIAYERKEVNDHGKILAIPIIVVELSEVQGVKLPIGEEVEIKGASN